MLNLHERRVKIFENLCYDIIYLYFCLLKRSLAVCFFVSCQWHVCVRCINDVCVQMVHDSIVCCQNSPCV